jgi:hypothetical protein
MSQQNKTQLQSTINTNIADNTVGDITAQDVRDSLINITDSLLFNSGSQTFDGTLTATAFVGDGSGITGVTGEWDGSLNGNAEITGSLTVTGDLLPNRIAKNGTLEVAGSFLALNSLTTVQVSGPSGISIIGDPSIDGDVAIEGNTLMTGSLTASGSVVDFTDATSISGSTFSGSFVGDGSGLTGVTGEWDGTLNGNAEITGSLIVSSSVVDFTDATAISGSTFSGSFVGDGSGLTLPSTSGTAKMFSGVFTEVTGGSPALALTTERNDFDSTSPLIASKLGAGYWQFTFSGGAFDLNSSNTVYSFQPTPANSTVSVGFYSADTQGGNTIQIYARDTTGAMADGLLDDVEFRITQFSS